MDESLSGVLATTKLHDLSRQTPPEHATEGGNSLIQFSTTEGFTGAGSRQEDANLFGPESLDKRLKRTAFGGIIEVGREDFQVCLVEKMASGSVEEIDDTLGASVEVSVKLIRARPAQSCLRAAEEREDLPQGQVFAVCRRPATKRLQERR